MVTPPVPAGSSEESGGRYRPGPATTAFVVVVFAVGGVTRAFGTEAGLLALVLAVVALVIAPFVYHGTSTPPARHTEPGDGPDGDRSST
jgi:hypothetical protein